MAHFNKRHYEAIATVMQSVQPDQKDDLFAMQWAYTRDALATMFKADNYLFDLCRFQHACRKGSNVKAKTAHLKAV